MFDETLETLMGTSHVVKSVKTVVPEGRWVDYKLYLSTRAFVALEGRKYRYQMVHLPLYPAASPHRTEGLGRELLAEVSHKASIRA